MSGDSGENAVSLIEDDECQTPRAFAVGVRTSVFNWRMRQARLAKGLTQKQLAELAEVNVNIVQALEQLRRDYTAQWDVLDRVASALELAVEDVFPAWVRTKALRDLGTVNMPLALTEDMANDGDELLAGALQAELRQKIDEALGTLPQRERRVLELRFGLTGQEPATLERVARQFHFTSERCRQIEQKGLRMLRHPMRAGALRPFIIPEYEQPKWCLCPGSGRKGDRCRNDMEADTRWAICPECDVVMIVTDGCLPEHTAAQTRLDDVWGRQFQQAMGRT